MPASSDPSSSSPADATTWSGRDADLSPAMKERYGIRPRSRPLMIATAVGVAVLMGLVFWAGWKLANPPVQARLLTYRIVSDTRTDVTWEVQRAADATVYCVVRARDAQRRDVGYATVTVLAGADYAQPTYELTTLRKPATTELLGCGTDPNPIVDLPAFGPGVLPPPQAPPGVAPTL